MRLPKPLGWPTISAELYSIARPHLFQFMLDIIRSGDKQFAPPLYHGMSELPADIDVWNVVHHHGGFTAPQSDGLPLQWFSPEGRHGSGYATIEPLKTAPNEAMYVYTNHERAAMLWYHDHAMALTSLNVYAGLAGAFVIRDRAQDGLGLPDGEFEVPLVIQDRTFHDDGSLAYTMNLRDGEDTPVVNGKAYPFLAVQPRRYRLRILNGSNERFWRLRFHHDNEIMPFYLIGSDCGLREPLQLDSVLIGSGERIDLIVNFGHLPMGTTVTMLNFDAPVHFPDGVGPTIPEVMQFRVTQPLRGADTSTPPRDLAIAPIAPVIPAPDTPRREFVLYQKVINETILVNGLPFMAPNEDFVKLGSTEIWEYINLQHNAHPMHVHLVNFQVLDRQPLDSYRYRHDFEKWLDGGRRPAEKPVLANYLTGPPAPPDPDEVNCEKDTVRVFPASVTRIIIPDIQVPGPIDGIPNSGTELPATYVQHCHLLEHEDNDLMRPWAIVAREVV